MGEGTGVDMVILQFVKKHKETKMPIDILKTRIIGKCMLPNSSNEASVTNVCRVTPQ